MAARKQKQERMSAQVVEDEDCRLRYEVVAGIDVAKEPAVVCVRMPPAAVRKHRTSHLQAVPATVPAITGLAVYTRRTGTGVQDLAVRCTCTAVAILAGLSRATTRSVPAVRQPALRWVTCRTLTSVLLHDRSNTGRPTARCLP